MKEEEEKQKEEKKKKKKRGVKRRILMRRRKGKKKHPSTFLEQSHDNETATINGKQFGVGNEIKLDEIRPVKEVQVSNFSH